MERQDPDRAETVVLSTCSDTAETSILTLPIQFRLAPHAPNAPLIATMIPAMQITSGKSYIITAAARTREININDPGTREQPENSSETHVISVQSYTPLPCTHPSTQTWPGTLQDRCLFTRPH